MPNFWVQILYQKKFDQKYEQICRKFCVRKNLRHLDAISEQNKNKTKVQSKILVIKI